MEKIIIKNDSRLNDATIVHRVSLLLGNEELLTDAFYTYGDNTVCIYTPLSTGTKVFKFINERGE